jgi:hypothetical protein
MTDRECGELFAAINVDCIGANHERTDAQLGQGCEDGVEVAFGARMQDMELQAELAGRQLRVSQTLIRIERASRCRSCRSS